MNSLNRSQKQLIETPDPRFNHGFQYTIPFDRFLTTLSIVYHVKMLVIQCFWAIQFQAQLWKNIIVCYTITIDSNRRLSPFNTQIQQWNPFSFTSTLFMLVQYNDFMRLSSTIQFIHLIVFIQSLPIYRMIKYNTFLFWTLNQTQLFQFGSFISHKFLIFILNIDHTKDWNMLAKPIWVVMKWWKRVNAWLDPKSINDQRMMVRGLEQTE